MNKREKTMLLMMLGMALLIAHVWGGKAYLESSRKKESKSMELAVRAQSYKNSAVTAEDIADEIDWIEQYEPEPTNFGEAQSALLGFLNKSGSSHGFTPSMPKLSPVEDSSGKFERTKIQISATASEEQIYSWLVDIHQPTEFRAVTQIIMRPTSKDDGMIMCTLTAEQWLLDSENL